MDELKKYLKLNLQHFAEGEGGQGDDGQTDPPEGDEGKGDGEPITLTAEELQRKIESESDKKLDKVLQKEREKRDAEIEARVQKALQEDKRLSKLSEAEKQEEKLKQREQKLVEREKEIQAAQVRSDAINELSNRKIDTNFVDFLATDDADETFDNIKKFNDLLDEVINEAVKASTRQDPPTRGGYKLGDGKSTDKSVVELAREKRIIK